MHKDTINSNTGPWHPVVDGKIVLEDSFQVLDSLSEQAESSIGLINSEKNSKGFSLEWTNNQYASAYLPIVNQLLQDIEDLLSTKVISPLDAARIRAAYLFIGLKNYNSDLQDSTLLTFVLENYFDKNLIRGLESIDLINYFLSTLPNKNVSRPRKQQILKPKTQPSKRIGLSRFAVAAAAAAAIGLSLFTLKSTKPSNSETADQSGQQEAFSQDELQSQVAQVAAALPELDPDDLELIEEETYDQSQSGVLAVQQSVADDIVEARTPEEESEIASPEASEPVNDQIEFQDFADLIGPSIQPSSWRFDYSTVGQIPTQLATYTVDTFISNGEAVHTVYMPLAGILSDPELSTVQFQVNTLRDPLVVRELIENNGEFLARKTDQRLAQEAIVHLTGEVQYAQVENDILPYVQTTDDDWVLYLYLNPLNPEVLNIPADSEDFIERQYVIPTSTFDESIPFEQPLPSISYDSLQDIDDVSHLVGKQVNYTSKAGSTRTYTCLSAEDGKLRLAHESGGSFYVNYSTTDQNLDLQQKYQGFEGQTVLYTTKQGTTDVYQCTSSENGKMLLKNSKGSFNVNWSTLESKKASIQTIQSDTQTRVDLALIS